MFGRIAFENYRGFESLNLDGLRRVNLVVGKNNAGKTSFLEGVAICVAPTQREEITQLFRPNIRSIKPSLYRWLIRDADVSEGSIQCNGQIPYRIVMTRKEISAPRNHGLQNLLSSPQVNIYVKPPQPESQISFSVVASQPRDADAMIKSFGQAVRQRSGEEQLESILRSVDSRIEKLRIDPGDDGNQIVVDIGLSELVPLSQVGQGIYRLVAIFSELIGERAKLCFIDEIENGLHHSVLETVWRGIAEVSDRMDVQVFATTHSYECIQAAHAAFAARQNYDFSIIQLFRVESTTQGRVLDRQHIEAALAGEIDLRGL